MEEEEEEYDSTWAESDEEPSRPPEPQRGAEDQEKTWPESRVWRRSLDHDKGHRRSKRAAMDLQRYRHHYPDLKDNVEQSGNTNFSFYMNKTCSQPNGCKIVEMLTKWKGKYEQLERNHSYIQWLFPLREPGMNWWAKELTIQEIKLFRQSNVAQERLVDAYKMMLDFYGIKLVNEETGEVKRAHHWKQRFHNLNLHLHNNLRITRILKCLGELGFEYYQTPLVKFFLVETLINKQLPQVKDSVLDYFLYTIRNKSERRKLILFAQQHYQPLSEFVWGPPKGTEHRFSHIQEELKKEVVEQRSEEGSKEDVLTKISEVPSEAGKDQTLKKKGSDSSKESTHFRQDSEQRCEDVVMPGTLNTISEAEEKVNRDGKSPVPEDTENQTEHEEEVITKGSEPDAITKNCKTKLGEKIEDKSALPVKLEGEVGSKQGKQSEGKLASSGVSNLMAVEDNQSSSQDNIRENASGLMDTEAETKPPVAEGATEGSKIGNPTTGGIGKRPGSGPITTEEEGRAEEDATGKMSQNTPAESARCEALDKPHAESETPSFEGESKFGEEMEIQEARPADECPGEKDVEMEENDD
ncbi:opioid growth factor receptor-like protein 1 [Narcine bancroftii]|uniref:opioid growth factor receptor-like protein 1 n=1 Tax=Narcine bancroftii TaxID=1343680 RepID=UPI003831AE3D